MKKLWILFLFLSGCVTVGAARRYGEQRYWEGRFDSMSVCIEDKLSQLKEKLKSFYTIPYDAEYDKLSDETAKETDEKFKDKEEKLGVKP